MVNKALFSSKSDEWSTPQDIFEALDKEFKFDLDPCATDDNHKTEDYYTMAEDGLSRSWGGVESLLILLIVISRLGLKKHIERQLRRIRSSFY